MYTYFTYSSHEKLCRIHQVLSSGNHRISTMTQSFVVHTTNSTHFWSWWYKSTKRVLFVSTTHWHPGSF